MNSQPAVCCNKYHFPKLEENPNCSKVPAKSRKKLECKKGKVYKIFVAMNIILVTHNSSTLDISFKHIKFYTYIQSRKKIEMV